MTRGSVRKETLLGCGVVVVAAAIMLPIALSMRRHSSDDFDAQRMRRLYVAISLYQESYANQPPPDLLATKLFVSDESAYVAQGDPYATGQGPFPSDGSLPKGPRRAPFRISFTYLLAHRSHLPGKQWSWTDLAAKRNLGFLASEWVGAVEPQGDFTANVSGPVLRLNVDGSLIKTSDRGGPKPLGDVNDLFLSPAKR